MWNSAFIDRCTLHDLRKTFVSQLAMADVNEAVVQKAVGHASMDTTLKHYTDILPETIRDAQNRLPYLGITKKIVSKSYHGSILKVEKKTA